MTDITTHIEAAEAALRATTIRSLTPSRFWDRVDKQGDTDSCWLWLGYRMASGYGQLRKGLAHRIAYEDRHGPIPEGLTLDHLCRNPPCVNPAHLEPVTNRENILRGTSPAANKARQTHCVRGHPFDVKNTYRHPRGGRDCRECKRLRQREYVERKRNAELREGSL